MQDEVRDMIYLLTFGHLIPYCLFIPSPPQKLLSISNLFSELFIASLIIFTSKNGSTLLFSNIYL
jgi:hypothetical protein